jgi:hypothetical protein
MRRSVCLVVPASSLANILTGVATAACVNMFTSLAFVAPDFQHRGLVIVVGLLLGASGVCLAALAVSVAGMERELAELIGETLGGAERRDITLDKKSQMAGRHIGLFGSAIGFAAVGVVMLIARLG